MSCQHSNTDHDNAHRQHQLPLHANPTLIPKSELGSSNPTADASHFRAFIPIISELYNSDSDSPSSTAATCPIGPSPSGRALDLGTFTTARLIQSSSFDSSLATCAPYSVIAAASTSATCPITNHNIENPNPNADSNSSLETCAPSSVIIAASSSATCPSTNADSNSSLETCAPSSVIIAASTSTTCPAYRDMQRAGRNEGENEHRGGRAKYSCYFCRLIMNRMHCRRKRPRPRRQTRWIRVTHGVQEKSSSMKLPWLLSPFHRAKRGSTLNVPSDEARMSTHVGEFISTPSSRRGDPVDVDEVSVGSSNEFTSRYRNVDDFDLHYHTEPTKMELKNRNGTVAPAYCDDVAMHGSQCHDDSEFLSQLGTEVLEGECCI